MALAFISMSFTHTIKAVKSNLKVDVTNSTIKWKGYKPTGSHEGTILLQTGNIELEDGKIVGGSFVVDMTSIKDADGSERLEGHLKSPDFFDVEIYGTSNFKISKVIYEGAKILVTGTMTIKGISKVTLDKISNSYPSTSILQNAGTPYLSISLSIVVISNSPAASQLAPLKRSSFTESM